MVTLSTPLRQIDAKAAPKLAKHRELHTVGDLLWFLPRRYLPRHRDLGQLVEGAYVVVVGEVESATARAMRARKGRILTVTITDGTHRLLLTFFKPYGHEGRLVPGATGLFAGKVSRYQQQWQLAQPSYELFDSDDQRSAPDLQAPPLIPVYLQVDGMPTWNVGRAAQVALDLLDDVDDPVPEELRRLRALPDLRESFRMAHQPHSWEETRQAQHRFRYEEALTIQTVLAQRRRIAEQQPARPRPRPASGGLLAEFDARLPFELTAGQLAVSGELEADLARDRPMHRLLQGEVGSGKTVVALRAMLQVVDAGGQAALLAPTEVLAGQHHRTITSMLGDLAMGGMLGGSTVGTQVELLTGSLSATARKRALLRAASGEAGIVVGTHALIQDQVQLADLGLVVVDEQHRFGVQQRDALRGKASLPPHVLVMTATPIPRTVAMTVFGDMETSTLAELPAGRSPIATHVVANPRWLQRTWERVAEEVTAGHQAYVVCPRIGDGPDDDTSGRATDEEEVDGEPTGNPAGDLAAEPEGQGEGEGPATRVTRSVVQVARELAENPALRGRRLGVLHGRLPNEDKDEVMRAFAAAEVDVLVSTTVIEVGVDVPNATVMVVMDADRFGVSQLHQLRGRVGRGAAPGLCLLVTDTDAAATVERLEAVAATTDGFELARLDLEQRREGDVLGARQSGRGSQLQMLSLLRDEEVILQARADAQGIVAADPDLSGHPALRQRVRSALDEDQAAYLERG